MFLLLLSKPNGKLCLVYLYYIDQSTLSSSSFTCNHSGSFISVYNFSAGFLVMNHLDNRSATLLSEPNMCITCKSMSWMASSIDMFLAMAPSVKS